jgi:hypothetical protein
MGRRHRSVAITFRRLYYLQMQHVDSCADAYEQAERIWERRNGSRCFVSLGSFKSSMSRFNQRSKAQASTHAES